MRKYLLILALFLPSILQAGYYDLQHNKVIRDTTTILNDWEWRGNFSIGQDTYTINLDNIQKGIILYGTGTVKSNDFRGDGSLLENIKPSNISAGILPNDVLASSLLPNTSNQPYVVWVTSAIFSLNAAGGVGGGGDTLPIGTIIPYISTSSIPTDYLYCDGDEVSRETYGELFDVIGVQFGVGDGSTTFNLPDFRGVVLRGLDDGRGFDWQGSTRVVGSYQQDSLQNHTHDLRFNSSGSGSTGDFDEYINSVQNYPTWQQNAPLSVYNVLDTTYTKTNSEETVMKNVAVPFLIKYRLSAQLQRAITADKTWRVLDTIIVTEATNTITINGLNGNVDSRYKINCRFIDGAGAITNVYFLRINGDSGTNYGYQNIQGAATTPTAFRDSGTIFMYVSEGNSSGAVSQSESLLYASSGSVRSMLTTTSLDMTSNIVPTIRTHGTSWNNIVDNITSVEIGSNQTDGMAAGTVVEIMTLSTATVAVGVASQVSAIGDAVIQADQDCDNNGLLRFRVKEQDIITANTSRIDLNRDTYLLGESLSFKFGTIAQDTTTLRIDTNNKIDRFRNIIFRPATSTTTVQQIINSINDNCATCQYVIKLDYGCIDEDLVVEPYVSLEGFGYNGTQISSITVLFEETIAVPSISDTIVFKNISIENYFDAILRNNYKTLSMINCIVRASATFTADNLTEIFNFVDTVFNAKPEFLDTALVSGNSTEFSQGIDINNNIKAQLSGGEINGVVTLNNSSNLVIKNSAVEAITDSIFCEYIVNDTSVLNIDPDTLAMAKITNNTGSNEYVEVMGGISAGVISPIPIITKNVGNSINISTARCFVFDNPNQFGLPRRFNVPAVSSQTIVDKTNNYVLIDYNNGSPIYQVSTTNSNNESDTILVYKVYLENGVIHSVSNDLSGEGLPNKILKRINNVEGFGRDYGIELGTGALQSVTVSEGVGWEGVSEISFNVFSSTSNDFEFYYTTSSGANWIRISTYTAYINDRYQTPTGLVNLLPGRHVCNYIYRGIETDAHVYFILGGQHTTVELARDESIPTSRPPVINEHAVYIGKLIIHEDGFAEEIVSGWEVSADGVGTSDHLSLSNLNAGDGVGNHANAANLQGRAGGQTLNGGTGAGENLTLNSTSNATKGGVFVSTWAVFDCANNRLGIGTTQPFNIFHSIGNASWFQRFSGTPAAGANNIIAKGRGTESSPSALQNGDKIGVLAYMGYDGSSWMANPYSATIIAEVDGTVSTGDVPGAIYFQTKSQGGSLTENMRITSFGTIFMQNLSGSTGESDLRYNTTTKEIFYDTSSEDYKENISTTTSTNWIYDVTVKQYNRIGDIEKETGLIAEDLELVKPEFVNYAIFEKNGEDWIPIKSYKNISDYYNIEPNIEVQADLIREIDSGEEIEEIEEIKTIKKRPVGINYSGLIPVIIKELQLLKKRVEILEEK
jgi:microcystin-dependent protein